MTPLHVSCRKVYKNIVRYLVEHESDINNEKKNGIVSLHYVSLSGNKNIVWYLVEHEADINKEDRYGNTPLKYASGYYEDTNIVRYLVEHGVVIPWSKIIKL